MRHTLIRRGLGCVVKQVSMAVHRLTSCRINKSWLQLTARIFIPKVAAKCMTWHDFA